MPIAFKEWAVTVRALAEGEQLVTLRKGGIREPNKHFEVEHDRFFLYPTFDHQRWDLVRESPHPAFAPPAWCPGAGAPPARAPPRPRGGRVGRGRAAGARADAGRRDPPAG